MFADWLQENGQEDRIDSYRAPEIGLFELLGRGPGRLLCRFESAAQVLPGSAGGGGYRSGRDRGGALSVPGGRAAGGCGLGLV